MIEMFKESEANKQSEMILDDMKINWHFISLQLLSSAHTHTHDVFDII